MKSAFRMACLWVVALALAACSSTPPSRPSGEDGKVATRGLPATPIGQLINPIQTTPTVWVFPAIRGTVLGPTVVKIDWVGLAGNYAYDVYRGTNLVGSVSGNGTALSVNDQNVTPGGSYAYSVAARPVATVSTTPVPGQATLTANTNLVTSSTITVTVPDFVRPAGLTATQNAQGGFAVQLSWPSAASYQPAYVVRRNGIDVATVTSTAFADALPGPGWYTYDVSSVAPGPNGQVLRSAPTGPVTVHAGPFHALAFGDSIMWGQGLAERAKFVNLVSSWVQGQLGLSVVTTNLAHSGATVVPPSHLAPPLLGVTPATFDPMEAKQGGIPNRFGEAPNSFPTISYQALTMGPSLGDPRLVDLILVDGCANDVGMINVLDPGVPASQMALTAQADCFSPLQQLLWGIHTTYPNARIILTGYYKAISSQSNIAATQDYTKTLGIDQAGIAAALQLVHTVAATAGWSISDLLADREYQFYNAATGSMMQAVSTLPATPKFADFADPLLSDANAYGAPQTHLWPVPTSPRNADDVFAQRQQLCASLPPSDPTFDPSTCPYASMGHPNEAGAQQYATAIEGRLQQFVPGWAKAFAPTQSWP